MQSRVWSVALAVSALSMMVTANTIFAAGNASYRPGEVLFQTYLPDNYAVKAAREQDYGLFYGQELTLRKEVGYPPFVRLAKLSVQGKTGEKTAEALARILGEEALGPVFRVKGKTTAWEFLVKGGEDLPETIRNAIQNLGRREEFRKARVLVDIDPGEMF